MGLGLDGPLPGIERDAAVVAKILLFNSAAVRREHVLVPEGKGFVAVFPYARESLFLYDGEVAGGMSWFEGWQFSLCLACGGEGMSNGRGRWWR